MYDKEKSYVIEKNNHTPKANHVRPMKKKFKDEKKIKDSVTESNLCINTEDALNFALRKLNHDASKLNLPKCVRKQAAKYFLRALEKFYQEP